MQSETNVDAGRRQFLQAAVTGAVVGLAARAGVRLPPVRTPPARGDHSPDSAMQELLAGNRRYAASQLTSIHTDLAALRRRTVEKQSPFAGVLACADSRVPVELVFDQSIGQLFVARIAGNIVTPEIIASLEYAVANLGIRALLVLGHTNCGAVKAAMESEAEPGQISALYPHLRPAVVASSGNYPRAVQLNASGQAELLRSSSTVIHQAIVAGKLTVSAGVYDLASGRVAVT
jgi:carbonic anhydrase